MDDIPCDILKAPCLAIIEAPTGEGKTEAALALAHRIAELRTSDEFYYALPTTATSNSMFGRIQKFLGENLELENQAQLIHGQAFLYIDDLRLEFLKNSTYDRPEGQEWFAPKKRALLAPFGVGTIDQAELAALNVKHVSLRLIGLAGKVLILDEVHAYDTYMTVIVERLLNWLRLLGTSVILLSATLPLERRKSLAQAYLGTEQTIPENNDYPAVWVISQQGTYQCSPQPSQTERILEICKTIQFSDDELEAKANWLLGQVEQGGCACWITNTVDRAQKLFAAVDAVASSEISRLLIHARYPMDKRSELEKYLVSAYGPNGKRPSKGIVIGTQVLEQSLDLDFDVMVTDLAPVDLLLQRAGRLHRHIQTRAHQHQQPRLWINQLRDDAGEVQIGVDKWIYDEYVLRLTWKLLAEKEKLILPLDYRTLIEEVYSDVPLPANDPLYQYWQEFSKKKKLNVMEAAQRILPEPDAERSFAARAARLVFEENEDSASWIMAKTRLGEERLTIIPLELSGEQARLPGSSTWLQLSQTIDREEELTLLRSSIQISQDEIIKILRAQEQPPLFLNSKLLRNSYPLWLTDNQAELRGSKNSFLLTLSPKLGLVIQRLKGNPT